MLKNLILFSASIMLSLLCAEGVTRAFYTPAPKKIEDFDLKTSSYYEPHSSRGWIPRANLTGRHDRRGSFESTFSTNTLGLRDRDYLLERPIGVTRIVVLGDSFAWGFGVSDGELFADYLEVGLSQTEVINLGVTAYGLRQEIDIFTDVGLAFDPQIAILAFVQNDVYRVPSKKEELTAGNSPAEGGVFRRIKRGLAENSALFTLVRDATSRHKSIVKVLVSIGLKEPPEGFEALDPSLMTALREYPAAMKESWAATFEDIEELHTICLAQGIRLIVATVPTHFAIMDGKVEQALAYNTHKVADFDLRRPEQIMAQHSAKVGYELMNPTKAFLASGQELYLPGDMHFSAAGHRLFADEILGYLAVTR